MESASARQEVHNRQWRREAPAAARRLSEFTDEALVWELNRRLRER
jgi:hypothetical protein